MALITTAEQLAEAIVTDPERVAACLGRINRFGGQAVGCSVLQHSLGVYYRSLAQPLSVRLWALLHDCHEILTGDVQRMYENSSLTHQQKRIDGILCEVLGITVSGDDAFEILQADIAAGTYEFHRAIAGRHVYSMLEPVADWVDSVRALLSEVTK